MSDAEFLRGAAALTEMLECIGEKDDHAVAKILCDNEMALRSFLGAALKQHVGGES